MSELTLFVEGHAAILKRLGMNPNLVLKTVRANLSTSFPDFCVDGNELKVRLQEVFDRIDGSN